MNPSLDPVPRSMLPAPDLIRRFTSIDVPQRLHLESLMASWSLLADLSFSDLLLFVPVTRDRGDTEEAAAPLEAEPDSPVHETAGAAGDRVASPASFVVLGQIRPTTSQTLYENDLVGQVQPVETLLEHGRGLPDRRHHPGRATERLR